MLSLMVVLSAYYLFTEDVNKVDLASTGDLTSKEIKVETQETAAAPSGKAASATGTANAGGKASADATQNSGSSASKQQQVDPTSAAGKETAQAAQQNAGAGKQAAESAGGDSLSDQQILQKVASQATSGSDYFASMAMKRDEEISKKTEQLLSIIGDSKQNTDAVAKAYDEMRKIEDQEAKVASLEDSLAKDYSNAIVMQDQDKWKVTVQSQKLEKSQAASILDQVMNELNVGPDKVSVQYVP
jgi:stage III sporulation protein AH